MEKPHMAYFGGEANAKKFAKYTEVKETRITTQHAIYDNDTGSYYLIDPTQKIAIDVELDYLKAAARTSGLAKLTPAEKEALNLS